MKMHEASMLAELVDPTPTWRTIQEQALTDPVLYHLVHMDGHGYADRQTLLIATVLWLARERREWMAKEVDRLAHAMPEARR